MRELIVQWSESGTVEITRNCCGFNLRRPRNPGFIILRPCLRGVSTDRFERYLLWWYRTAGTKFGRSGVVRAGTWSIPCHNGRIDLRVAPGFSGAVTGLRLDGEEMLRSPFPKSGKLGFESPWYGRCNSRKFPMDGSRKRRVSIGRGLLLRLRMIADDPWKGVEAHCRIRKDAGLQGGILRCRYLISADLPVAIGVVQLDNPTVRQLKGATRSIIFPGSDAHAACREVLYSKTRRILRRTFNTIGCFTQCDGYLCFASRPNETALALFCR